MSVRHPSCRHLEGPICGLWSRILWRLMPRTTRQALRDVVSENTVLVKQQSDRERFFVQSRKSLCDQSDARQAQIETLQAKLDWIGPMNTALAEAHEAAVLARHALEQRALPEFTDVVTTAIP